MIFSRRLLVVLGPDDAGKTSLLTSVLVRHKNEGNVVKLLDMRTTEVNVIMTAQQSGRAVDDQALKGILREGIADAVEQMRDRSGHCVLFIDEANLLPGCFPYQELIDLTKQKKACTIVLASSDSKFHDAIQHEFGERFRFVFIGDLTKTLAKEFWTTHLSAQEFLFEEAFAVFGGRMFDLEEAAKETAGNISFTRTLLFSNFNQRLAERIRGKPDSGYSSQDATAMLELLIEQETLRGVAAVARATADSKISKTAVDGMIKANLLCIRGAVFVMDIDASPPFLEQEFPLLMVARPAFTYIWKHNFRHNRSLYTAGTRVASLYSLKNPRRPI